MIKKTVTQKVYCIEVGVDGLLDIMRRDKNFSKPTVGQMLERLDGVSHVEYDGHFGPYVFLTLDVEDDTEETWKMITCIIGV